MSLLSDETVEAVEKSGAGVASFDTALELAEAWLSKIDLRPTAASPDRPTSHAVSMSMEVFVDEIFDLTPTLFNLASAVLYDTALRDVDSLKEKAVRIYKEADLVWIYVDA